MSHWFDDLTKNLASAGSVPRRSFLQLVAAAAGVTLHVTNHYGANNHHIAETCFKAVARVLRAALERDPRQPDAVPSTKGSLKG